MKNDFITWVWISGLFVSDYFMIWPPFNLNWLSYVFFCLMGVFLLLIGKRAGHLTRNRIIVLIVALIIGCICLYFLNRWANT